MPLTEDGRLRAEVQANEAYKYSTQLEAEVTRLQG